MESSGGSPSPSPSPTSPAAPPSSWTSRLAAAGVASSLATVLCTPLDVLKTRLQVEGRGLPPPAASARHVHWVLPVRGGAESMYLCLAIDGPGPPAHSALAHAIHGEALTSHGRLSSLVAGGCPNAARAAIDSAPSSVAKTFRRLVREEGVQALWKGLDTALLLNIPMIALYMPLYDHLHAQLSRDLGFYAPALAGMAARTATVVATAPLELLRTRKQASSSPSSAVAAAWQQALRPPVPTAGSAAAAGTSGKAAAAAAADAAAWLRPALARARSMWTGVGATLARDVPFTVLYWLAVEPIRKHLLAQPPLQLAVAAAVMPLLSERHASSLAASSSAPGTHGTALSTQQQLQPSSSLPSSSFDDASTAPVPSSSLPYALPTSTPPPQPSSRQVLWANLVAGSVAGGLAATVTTPFDVVKTRLQAGVDLGGGAHACRAGHCAASAAQPPGTLDTLRGIWKAEGVRGLFAGVVPRAARAAPACAIVLSTYEVLKTLM